MKRSFTDIFGFDELLRQEKQLMPGSNISFSEKDITLNKLLKVPAGSFLIRVQGDSMINAGIQSGDLILANNNFNSAIGKIIIAQVDNKITLKKYVKIENEYFLKPENDKYKLLKINNYKNFKIWGIASKVIKDVTDRIG